MTMFATQRITIPSSEGHDDMEDAYMGGLKLGRLATADDSTIARTLELAQHVGAPVLARAAAAVADQRGMTSIVRKYVHTDDKRGEMYVRREMLPSTTTLSAITGSLRPVLSRDALRESEQVKRAKQAAEQNKSLRRSILSRR